jgi:hypothetical protein
VISVEINRKEAQRAQKFICALCAFCGDVMKQADSKNGVLIFNAA